MGLAQAWGRLCTGLLEGREFRELYAMLGLRAEVHADGELDITVGASNTKGVMPCDRSS